MVCFLDHPEADYACSVDKTRSLYGFRALPRCGPKERRFRCPTDVCTLGSRIHTVGADPQSRTTLNIFHRQVEFSCRYTEATPWIHLHSWPRAWKRSHTFFRITSRTDKGVRRRPV